MKRIVTCLSILLLPAVVIAQQVSEAKKYKCMNGWIIEKGGNLILGQPTGKGNFLFINESASGKKEKDRLPAEFQDSAFVVDNIKKYLWDSEEENAYAIIKVGREKYFIDIEPAISSGELRIPDGYVKTNLQSEDSYTLDDNGNITIAKVLEAPGVPRDEIYSRALNYFTYNYGSGKAVIQTQDKEKGTIVGKGIYSNVHSTVSLVYSKIDTWHIVRIDVKEGKARVIVTLTEYDKTVSSGRTPDSHTSLKITECAPFGKGDWSKGAHKNAFKKSVRRANLTIASIENSILTGNTSGSIENADW